ncbi:MAG TPA: response regulator [Xanthobacteraceae bacterium]|nr:response regulator [Xanthobacteraceae bacterium]
MPLQVESSPGDSPHSPCESDTLFLGDSELARRMREIDWAATPLGPPDGWPQSLKTAVRIMLTSRQPIWIGWGKELIYLYNDPYKSIIGGKHPWALGKPTSEVWREIWDHIGPMLASAMEGHEGTYVEAQLLIMERNGYPEETYYTFSYSPIPTDDGTPGGIFCANTDDTQRVIGERQLALLRELAAGTSDARTWRQACERAARALATNPRDLPFAMIYMLEPDGETATLAGTTGIDVGHPAAAMQIAVQGAGPWPFADVLREHRQAVCDLGQAFGAAFPHGAWPVPPTRAAVFPIPASGDTGRSGFLIAGLNPFRVFDDDYAGFLNLVAGQIAAAVTNAEAYEQERRRAEALAEIDRAKTRFFSNVSHEFRTPLTLMLSPLEEVLGKPEGGVPPDDRRLVSLAHRNGTRLLKLVNTLLDFSRIEAGKAQASFEPLDLAAVTSDIASTFRSAVERAGLRLRIDSAPLPEPVYADRDMLEKIILNLVSNAFKFTFEGEIAVRTAPSADGTMAEIIVSDTGTGIPAEEIPRLFERFHRVEGARGRSLEGSGIGLALVLELIRLHTGTVHVESEVGRGSVFTVRLPFGTAHLPAARLKAPTNRTLPPFRAEAYVQEALSWLDDEQATDAPTASGPQDLVAPSPAGAGGRTLILLADDNADMRRYVQRLLEAAGHRVEAVADGEAALSAARACQPDLILSDVMMPKLDGFGLLDRLRSDETLKEIPVILLSARAGEEAKVEGLRSGADDYLIKPFSSRELLARVDANLGLARTRNETARLLREETHVLEILNRVGVAISAELDLERAVQVVTDAATELTGAAFGSFFYNVSDERGGSYMLYTLSGAPREAFAHFPMPRNTAVFGPTFRGEGVVRSADITQDPRYGKNAPYFGMPKGHLPVRSYLAAPVVARNGEVLGGLFFGHPEPGVFDARSERFLAAIAVQAAVAIEKARLYRAAQEEIEHRKRIEAALRESEQSLERKVEQRTAELAAANARLTREAAERERAEGQFEHLVRSVADYAVFMLNPRGIISSWNIGAERIKGYRPSEIIGRHFETFYTEEDRAAGKPARALETAAREGKFEAEGWRVRKDGSRFWANVVINPIRDKNGDLIGFAKVTRDITERREAQEALIKTQAQLAQAQKMEGIGQLTGGVAHDFNNLLTVIIGNLESIQRQVRTAAPDRARLERSADLAMRGARRAEALTHRLLAFSRQQPLAPKPIDIGRLVSGMSDLLRRTIGEQIAVETVLAGGLWRTYADPNHLEIAILNLAVNARDAMPQGGKLTIETGNVYLDERYASDHTEVSPGQYVMLAISDTGAGMTREVLARAFEPFFTTKDVGHGTGLGLSQVYGFVKQSGGHVKIYSEVGAGTTVKLYFPRLHSDAPEVVEEPVAHPQGVSGTETILVVEDDRDVRTYTSETLRELGYRVLEAGNAAAALQVLDEHPEIELLFTDIGLPGGMNGRRLSEAALQRRPDVKVLFTTGYARNAIVHEGRLDPGVELVTKPFNQAVLAARLRDILDARSGPARILVVEDEVLLQMLAVDTLEEAGFKVDTAGSASEAMSKLRLIPGGVDAAVVDIGLPDRGGDVLVRELRTVYPTLPIVIVSGRDRRELQERFKREARMAFIGKPYSPADVLDALRTVGISGPPSG